MRLDVVTLSAAKADAARRYAPLTATNRIIQGNRAAAIGDSITDGNSQFISTEETYDADSWFNAACVLSGGRFINYVNAGIAGETTAQMLARINTDIVAYAPDVCFILGGANDPDGGLSNGQSIANLLAMYEACLTANIVPIPCTCNPRDSRGGGAFSVINSWIRSYCLANRLAFLDFEAITIDPLNGLWIAAYSVDKVHPYSTAGGPGGVLPMALHAVDRVADLFPPFNPPLSVAANPSSGTKYDVANLLLGGLFTVDTNADGVGDNWTASGTGTCTYSRVLDSAGHGYLQEFNRTVDNANFNQLSQTITEGSGLIVAGHRYAMCGRLQVEEPTPTAPVLATIKFNYRNTGGSSVKAVQLRNWDMVCADGTFYFETDAPATVTNMRTDITVQGGVGKVRWGQLTVRDLTALGL